eukprot:8060961-Pyramimonas_sp.AAC.1
MSSPDLNVPCTKSGLTTSGHAHQHSTPLRRHRSWGDGQTCATRILTARGGMHPKRNGRALNECRMHMPYQY